MTGPGGAVSGIERRPIALPITITAADLDVFVTLSVRITGVPDYATLSAGTSSRTGHGCWLRASWPG